MNREQAVKYLSFSGFSDEQIKAIEGAFSCETCEDAISRQRMLKYFEGWKNQIKYYHPYAKNFDIPYEEAIQWVKDMPSVNPLPKALTEEERALLQRWRDNRGISMKEFAEALDALQEPKTGHWVFDEVLDRHYYCSECKSMGVDYWNYCPNCGAKMTEEEDKA